MMISLNLEPVYAIVFSLIIFGEKELMSTQFYIGVLIILVGVVGNGIYKRQAQKNSPFPHKNFYLCFVRKKNQWKYLDFELPIKDINDQLGKCRVIGDESEIDVSETCAQLEQKAPRYKERDLWKFNPMAARTIIASPFSTLYFRLYQCFMRGYFFRVTRRSKCARRQGHDRWIRKD